jgi:hypothetical protein
MTELGQLPSIVDACTDGKVAPRPAIRRGTTDWQV